MLRLSYKAGDTRGVLTGAVTRNLTSCQGGLFVTGLSVPNMHQCFRTISPHLQASVTKNKISFTERCKT